MLAADTQTAKGAEAKPQPVLLTTDEAVKAAAAAVLASGEFKAAANETLLLHAPAGLKGQAPADCRPGQTGQGYGALRAQCGRNRGAICEAARHSRAGPCAAGAGDSEVALPAGPCTRAAAEGAFVGDFDPDTYRSDRKDLSVQSFTLAAPGNADEAALEAAFAEGVIVGESQNFARTLVNEPGNKLTPTVLGQRAAADG